MCMLHVLACLRRAAAQHGDVAVLGTQLQVTGVQEVGALVGVALAKQQSAGRQFLERRLAGECAQVLQAQAVQR